MGCSVSQQLSQTVLFLLLCGSQVLLGAFKEDVSMCIYLPESFQTRYTLP
jgi:hypothetical protein